MNWQKRAASLGSRTLARPKADALEERRNVSTDPKAHEERSSATPPRL
jgi:hypothetical protein